MYFARQPRVVIWKFPPQIRKSERRCSSFWIRVFTHRLCAAQEANTSTTKAIGGGVSPWNIQIDFEVNKIEYTAITASVFSRVSLANLGQFVKRAWAILFISHILSFCGVLLPRCSSIPIYHTLKFPGECENGKSAKIS